MFCLKNCLGCNGEQGFSFLFILPFIHSFMAPFCERWSRTAFERAMIKWFFFFFFFRKIRLGCWILDNPCGNAPVRWESQWSTVTAPSQARPLLGAAGVQRSGVDDCFETEVIPAELGHRGAREPQLFQPSEISLLLMHVWERMLETRRWNPSISHLCQYQETKSEEYLKNVILQNSIS